MGEDLSLTDRINRDLRGVRWPEPAEIRARARRRTRLTVVAAAVALLAVPVPAVFALRSTPAPTAAPSGRAEIPQSALLDPGDLALPGADSLGETGLREPVRVNSVLEACGDDLGLPPPRPESHYSRSQLVLGPSGDDSGTAAVVFLNQDVYRLPAADAGRFVGDLTETVEGCRERWTEGRTGVAVNGEVIHHWAIVERDFAGDDALLLRLTITPPPGAADDFWPPPEHVLVVRVGDLVSVVAPTALPTYPPFPWDATATRQVTAELTALGRTAAERLCTAANPRC